MNHCLSPMVEIFMERETSVALMFSQINILIASKNSEILQIFSKKKLEACLNHSFKLIFPKQEFAIRKLRAL